MRSASAPGRIRFWSEGNTLREKTTTKRLPSTMLQNRVRRHLPILAALGAMVLIAGVAGFYYSRPAKSQRADVRQTAPRGHSASARTPVAHSAPARPPVGHAAPARPPVAGAWALSFDDEFSHLSRRIWQRRLWWNGDTAWPTDELQVYEPFGVTVGRGHLVLTARRASVPLVNWKGHASDSSGEPFSWTSGLVSSGGIMGVAPIGFAQRYGYFEARIKMPARGAGFLPAFWLQGVNGKNGSPASHYSDKSEIDIVEVHAADPNTILVHLHDAAHFAASYPSPTKVLGGGYHTYGVDWEPGHVAWFYDGKKIAQYNGTALNDQPPHYILLNLAVGGTPHSFAGTANRSTPSPARMMVDFVRVWRH